MSLPKAFAAFAQHIPHLSLISKIAQKQKVNVWLVGGFLRDLYLKKNKKFYDFDFCVEKNVRKFVHSFSKETASKSITLDETQGSFRVIIKKENFVYTYDFTLMRGKDIYEDLSLRDFSINTLAVSLNCLKREVIDCFNGRRDLRKKLIRVVHKVVLSQDPLRILRGFSFMVNYGFHIEKNTERAMVAHKRLLKNVSGERINEELFKILASDHSYQAIKKMSDLKIIDEIIPYIDKARGVKQGSYHHLDVWNHSLETLRGFEALYRKRLAKNRDISGFLDEELAKERTRLQILKLACLLHDIGKPAAKKEKNKKTIFYSHEKIGRDMADEVASMLRLSLREREVLKKLIFWHLRPGFLADQLNPSQRAIYRFFRDTEGEGIGVIALSISDWRATRGPLVDTANRPKHERFMFKLIERYFREKKRKPLPKLVDGFDIMHHFKLSPSPLIGKILKKIKEEQALGAIRTKSEALRAAKAVIAKSSFLKTKKQCS
jgi:poly(A) polymerase